MNEILIALGILGALGLIFGAVLGVASNVFRVDTDERIEKIVHALPGANCGGCGYAGCANFADAVVSGNAPADGCPVSNADQKAEIGKIMGVEVHDGPRMAATVLCRGSHGVVDEKYIYYGADDCRAAARLGGGYKECRYSCLGLGTCVGACKFGAISIKDGIAHIDREKCTACGACIEICPKHVIELAPADADYIVMCHSKDKGNVVNKICRVGCISCRLCEKACPTGAVSVVDNIAKIDYTKCIECGACAEKCPRGIISEKKMHIQ